MSDAVDLSWKASKDLGHKAGDEVVGLLLSQQDWEKEERAAEKEHPEPGCSQISPGISKGCPDKMLLIPTLFPSR